MTRHIIFITRATLIPICNLIIACRCYESYLDVCRSGPIADTSLEYRSTRRRNLNNILTVIFLLCGKFSVHNEIAIKMHQCGQQTYETGGSTLRRTKSVYA